MDMLVQTESDGEVMGTFSIKERNKERQMT